MNVVHRPLWRAFEADALDAAARHARAGGISVVRARRWFLVGEGGDGRGLPPYVDWAIRAIEVPKWRRSRHGDDAGCVRAHIPAALRERVMEWVARDRAHEGATTTFSYDCVACGACCFGAEVVIEPADLRRFREGDRADLTRRTRPVPGADWRILPTVSPGGPCVHLGAGHLCEIYALRPNMCRDFLAGSEHCLTSRDEKYGSSFPEGR